MNERYVISIKTKIHNEYVCSQWRYAVYDRTEYPRWNFPEFGVILFSSVKSAKKWFDQNKKYLFGSNYNIADFDMSTLAIRKITYKKELSLTVEE